jgi:hypothetical protein
MTVSQILPCFTRNSRNVTCGSSAITHAALSSCLGVVVALGITLALYFCLQSPIWAHYLALPAGLAVLTVSYIALRLLFGKAPLYGQKGIPEGWKARKAGTESTVKQRELEACYQGDMPDFLVLHSNQLNKETITQHEAQYALLLADRQEIFNLSLDEVKKFTPFQKHALLERLRFIEQVNQTADPTQIRPGSLAELRSLKGKKLFDIPKEFYPYLSTDQAKILMQKRGCLGFALPTETIAETRYTQLKLLQLIKQEGGVDLISSFLPMFSIEQLKLLPAVFFRNQAFPWDKVAKHFDAFLPIDDENSRRIAQSLPKKIIQRLGKHFKKEHLRLFSREQLDSNGFPWENFFKLPGIGIEMRKIVYSAKPAKCFNFFPWRLLAKHKQELLAFLKIYDLDESQPFYQSINKDHIQYIAPLLPSAQPLLLFSKDQRNYQKFPEEIFRQKSDFNEMNYE